MVCALIKMGGKGTRFGGDIPKQYLMINEKPLFSYLLEVYNQIAEVDKYIIISNEEWIDYTNKYATEILGQKLLGVIKGGETGAKSIYNGIMFAKNYLLNEDILLIHDVTNPIVQQEMIKKVIDCALEFDFAVLATEQVHTIYTIDDDGYINSTLDRKAVCSGYSPEAFRFGKIYNCYLNANDEELEQMTSAVALANKYGVKVKTVVTNLLNLKITYKSDLDILKRLI